MSRTLDDLRLKPNERAALEELGRRLGERFGGRLVKLVVFGSAVWISNSVQYPPNRDLFANSVNWLVGSEEAISIRPKQTANRRLFLDNVRAALMTWVTIVLTPLALIGLGIFRWWRRRSL